MSPAFQKMNADFLAAIIPTKKSFKIEDVKPVLRPDAKRIRLTYGPYKLKGLVNDKNAGNSFTMDPQGTSYWNQVTGEFPRDITVLDAVSRLVDENMQDTDIAKGIYNHHVAFWTPNRAPIAFASCGNGKASPTIPVSIFMGGATEALQWRFTSEDGKFNSGFYLAPDASVHTMIDVVNYNNDSRTVYSVSEMEYIPGKVPKALDASQDVMNIGMCSGSSGFNVKSNDRKVFSFGGSNITVSQDGYIVNARGHLHDGGVNMEVKLNDKVVCDSKAEYGGPGHEGKSPEGKAWSTLASTTACEKPIKVSKGDQLAITANFNLEKYPPRPHAQGASMAEEMGLLLVTFAKDP